MRPGETATTALATRSVDEGGATSVAAVALARFLRGGFEHGGERIVRVGRCHTDRVQLP